MTKKTAKNSKNCGFTIIELLVATVVFSVVLVMLLAAFVQISRLFYKGVSMSNTQDATRAVVNDISSDIQFALATPLSVDTNPASSGSFCIGTHRYAYYTGTQVGSTPSLAGFFRENESGTCQTLAQQSVDLNTANQLLGVGMQLNHLQITCQSGACQVNVHVVFYGSDPSGLFSSAIRYSPAYQAVDAECTGSLESSQYCSTADFTNIVLQRI